MLLCLHLCRQCASTVSTCLHIAINRTAQSYFCSLYRCRMRVVCSGSSQSCNSNALPCMSAQSTLIHDHSMQCSCCLVIIYVGWLLETSTAAATRSTHNSTVTVSCSSSIASTAATTTTAAATTAAAAIAHVVQCCTCSVRQSGCQQ
jgi:hypothetical protein